MTTNPDPVHAALVDGSKCLQSAADSIKYGHVGIARLEAWAAIDYIQKAFPEMVIVEE